jgi:uncharacterized protein
MASMPQPQIDNWNKTFWDACRERRLIAQKCRATKQLWLPPAPISPFVPRAGWDWVQCSGFGTVVSWVVFHQQYFAAFADRIPYNCAIVNLDEGPKMVTNISAPNDAIEIGQRVTVAFEPRGDFVVPIFVPAN